MKLKVPAVVPDDGQAVQIVDQAIESGICVQLKAPEKVGAKVKARKNSCWDSLCFTVRVSDYQDRVPTF